VFSLSLSVARRIPLWCVVEYIRQLEVRRITSLTRFVLVFFCLWLVTGPFVVCLCGGFGLSFLCFLAVFSFASVFNQDVSEWNTGVVTDMAYSKCTRSPPLCGHGAFRCGVLLSIYDNSRFVGSQVSHILFFFSFVVGNGTFLLFAGWFGLSFLFCALLSCSVSGCICVQSGRVHLEYGGGDKDGLQ
jgi:surface protein